MLGFVNSAALKPICYFLINEETKGCWFWAKLKGYSLNPRIVDEEKKKTLLQEGINSITDNFLVNEEKHENLKHILDLYRIAHLWEEQEKRVIIYWVILESLSYKEKGRNEVARAKKFIKNYFEGKEKLVGEIYGIRSDFAHQGRFSKKYTKRYNTSQRKEKLKEIRLFVEELMEKILLEKSK